VAEALTGGYHAAFIVAAGFAVLGALAALYLRPVSPPGQEPPDEEAGEKAKAEAALA
jgi:hypothetical protein